MNYSQELLTKLAAVTDPDSAGLKKISIGTTSDCPSCGHSAPIGQDPDGENKKPMKIKMASHRVEVTVDGVHTYHDFGRVLAVCPLCKTVTGTFLPVKPTHTFGVLPE